MGDLMENFQRFRELMSLLELFSTLTISEPVSRTLHGTIIMNVRY